MGVGGKTRHTQKQIVAERTAKWEALKRGIEGKWQDEKTGPRTIKPNAAGNSWACLRANLTGRCSSWKKFELWYDEENDLVWWGDWSYCLDASEARKGNGQLRWFGGKDRDWHKPRFIWHNRNDMLDRNN